MDDRDILLLFKNKEKIFDELSAYVCNVQFDYNESEIDKFSSFVNNLSVYIRAARKNQAIIDSLDKDKYETDKEVRNIEERCRKLARKAYEKDEEINKGMTKVMENLRAKYKASKNENKFYRYTKDVAYISESFASFDAKK